jgi:hypothetical protein
MAIDVKTVSRLRFTRLLVVDDVEFWDTLVLPDAIARPDDIQYTVTQRDRIDLLATRFYQDPGLWWVLAWANNLEVLPTDMKENMQLRIPSKEFVFNDLIRKVARRV